VRAADRRSATHDAHRRSVRPAAAQQVEQLIWRLRAGGAERAVDDERRGN
jgi:hypothetical protein